MHLKSLTMRGFKSFASATTLHFEPGITAVVGPNGSGKSNVVDALAWVMGEQGAKSLRGGSMQDVIFAGTAGRPPLGRAEVTLTIDNTDGLLPIEFSEVTLSRTMFRNGGSEYAINGRSCRLLDVQELLSDSGIGREMHVIVGQGQLDAVLQASPEDRRGFVEEAAGVLKHRKRKEKALRKLEAMQANVTRLSDLTSEIRRQLAPLGRQADVARRAQGVQADLRDARARLLADDLHQLLTTVAQEEADQAQLRSRRQQVEQLLGDCERRVGDLEARLAGTGPRLEAAVETWYRLSALRERLQATAALASERVRLLGAGQDGPPPGRNPEERAAQAAAARRQESDLSADAEQCRTELDAAAAARQTCEQGLAAAEAHLAAALRAAADSREGLARLSGQVQVARSRVEAAGAERGRLEQAHAEALRRGERAAADYTALEVRVVGVEQGEQDLDAEHERAESELHQAQTQADLLHRQERDAERERAAWAARKEALESGLTRKDGTEMLLAAGERLQGLLGSVPVLLDVEAGAQAAVAAALGALADAVVVDSADSAAAALDLLRSDSGGQAQLVVAGQSGAGRVGDSSPAPALPALPEGVRPVRALVRAPQPLQHTLDRLLHGYVLAADLATASALVRRHPELVVVTGQGDVLSAHAARGGSPAAASLLEVQAAVDEAAARLAEAARAVEQTRFALQAVRARQDDAQARVQSALDRLHDSDARHAAVAEQLGTLGAAVRAAHHEGERLDAAAAAAAAVVLAGRRELEALEHRLEAAQQAPDVPGQPSTRERDRLAAAAVQARADELDARLALRTVEERARALSGRAQSLERAARQEREARAQAQERAARRARHRGVAAAVGAGASQALEVLEVSLRRAAAEKEAAERVRAQVQEALAQARGRAAVLAGQLGELTEVEHRDDLARAAQRVRLEQLEQRSTTELGLDPESLLGEYGPAQPVPWQPDRRQDAAGSTGDPTAPRPYRREEQEKRLRSAERALASLGRVNPLALEEFAALEERHAFLTEQLADLRTSRRDLLDIIREVDERVEQVFAAAFADTAEQFRGVFARLFPGGEGRLVLTDPDDMLGTGIEVEARPPGKKVKRLSLLSGGERSLTAVALLVAIFKARPSPFYVLDEVEAALDDTNLGRLIGLLQELRESSQLLVVTHQKRTMQGADALYGVTMRGDGVTTVVSQRLRESQPA